MNSIIPPAVAIPNSKMSSTFFTSHSTSSSEKQELSPSNNHLDPTQYSSSGIIPSTPINSSFLSSSSLTPTSSMGGKSRALRQSRLSCLRYVKVLRRLTDALLILPSLPPVTSFTSSSSPLEWRHNFISPKFKDFIEVYEAQHALLFEWRHTSTKHPPLVPPSPTAEAGNMEKSHPAIPSSSPATSPSIPFSRIEVALWCLTLAYGIFLSSADYSFWSERFQLITNSSLMIYMATGFKYSEESQAVQYRTPPCSVMDEIYNGHDEVDEDEARWNTPMEEDDEKGSGDVRGETVGGSRSSAVGMVTGRNDKGTEQVVAEASGREVRERVGLQKEEKKKVDSFLQLGSMSYGNSKPSKKGPKKKATTCSKLVQQYSLFPFPTNAYFSTPLPAILPPAVKVIPINVVGEKTNVAHPHSNNINKEEGGLFVVKVSPPEKEKAEEEEEWETVEEAENNDNNENINKKRVLESESDQNEENNCEDDEFLEEQYKNLVDFWMPTPEDILANPRVPSSSFNFSVLSPSLGSSPGLLPSEHQHPQLSAKDQEGRKGSWAPTIHSNTTDDDETGGGEVGPLSQQLSPISFGPHLNLTPSAPRFSIWRAIKWELDATVSVVYAKPKNFQVWNHRLLLLQHAIKHTKSEMVAFAKMNMNSISASRVGEDLPNHEVNPPKWALVGRNDKSEESEENWNQYLQYYHHHALSLETDFDDRPLIEEALKDSPKNYHAWLYRADFLRLFPFYAHAPSLVELQEYLGISSRRQPPASSIPSMATSTTASTIDAPCGSDGSADDQQSASLAAPFGSLLPLCPLRKEFILTNDFISDDVMNNSAWSHRYAMFHTHLLFPLQQEFRATLLDGVEVAEKEKNEEKDSQKGLAERKQFLEEAFGCTSETAKELCHREVTYALAQLDKNLSNECPLTYARSVAEIFQTFSIRLEIAKTLVESSLCVSSASTTAENSARHAHARAFISSFSNSLKEALCFVLGSLSSLNITSSRLKMKAVHDCFSASIWNTKDQVEEKEVASYAFPFAGCTGDDHEVSWPTLFPIPHHFYLSSLVSWPAYRRSFGEVFQLYDAIYHSFRPKVEAQEDSLLALLQRGGRGGEDGRKALHEIQSTYLTQMSIDHLGMQCESATYHLLYFFLEQLWNLYFCSMEKGSLIDPKGKEVEPSPTFISTSASPLPRVAISQRRPPTDYAREGLVFDMLYPERLLSQTGDKEEAAEDGRTSNANGDCTVVRDADYESMIELFLYVEAYALLFAKNLEEKDPCRKKYWRHEVTGLMFRRYSTSF